MTSKKYAGAVTAAIAILIWVALDLVGGPQNHFEAATIQAIAAERLAHPWLTEVGLWASFAGSAPVTQPLLLFGAAYLVWRGQIPRAVALIAIAVSERYLVEYLKLWIGRPRPDVHFQAVAIQSLAFPSGHAANSMTAFVAVALFCAPQQHRRTALIIAVAASVLVGLSRPLLGVHWPSDVAAGWILGFLWAVGWWRIANRFETRAA